MFRFKLLGTAAGGGCPQWNCSCALCELSRNSPEIAPLRLQLQAAMSTDGDNWFLINASPDLRAQIEQNAELQPRPGKGKRNTPIQAIILTSADLDQVLGLLLLREFQPLTVYATRLVRQVLEANSFFRMLERVPNQLTWKEIHPGRAFEVEESGIFCTPIPLKGSLPTYAKEMDTQEPGQSSLGLVVACEGRRIAYTPALPEVTDDLLAVYRSCDTVLVDGTFWSDAELTSTHSGTPAARDIGHIPLCGEDGTIALLRSLTEQRRIFVHINNTNPVLDPRSAERAALVEAGWQLGYDGWQLA
ncbi:MAG TPA: pyrroloquinoline quinone biosynthesis protein PqqB [Granulicella sp.]